jgi:hypothetical protein
MKQIYAEVAMDNELSEKTVRDYYLRHRDLADRLAKSPRSNK